MQSRRMALTFACSVLSKSRLGDRRGLIRVGDAYQGLLGALKRCELRFDLGHFAFNAALVRDRLLIVLLRAVEGLLINGESLGGCADGGKVFTWSAPHPYIKASLLTRRMVRRRDVNLDILVLHETGALLEVLGAVFAAASSLMAVSLAAFILAAQLLSTSALTS